MFVGCPVKTNRVHGSAVSPKGETAESMEKERIALLTEVKNKNNEAVIKEKIHFTFSYRRQELVEDLPMVSDLQSRWPALFTVNEVSVIDIYTINILYISMNSSTIRLYAIVFISLFSLR